MILNEREFEARRVKGDRDLLTYFQGQVKARLTPGDIPVRFAVTATGSDTYRYEVGALTGRKESNFESLPSIFRFVKRTIENVDQFNVALVIPTGIGAELGGHDGDAGSLSKLLGVTCDRLITHPNVVNASDINELPANGL